MSKAEEMFKELGYIEHFNTDYAEIFRKDSKKSFGRQIAFNQKTKSIMNENYISMQELQAINEKVGELRMDKINEIWKDIKGYENKYQVSNLGRVKSLERYINSRNGNGDIQQIHKERILKNNYTKRGYVITTLHKNGKPKSFYIHRLVAEAFIDNPNNFIEINHIDKNKQNNKVNNLEWCTRTYNNTYSKARKVNQYNLSGELIKTWQTIKQASKENNIFNGNIISCCKGKVKTAGGFVWKYTEKH